jgi:hypothetical protein
MNDRQTVMVHDLLHNLHPQSCSGSHKEKANYARGVLVSVVGMIQAFSTNMDFEAAIAIAASHSPRVVVAGCCPDSWCKAFGMPEVGERKPNESWDMNVVVRTGPAYSGRR